MNTYPGELSRTGGGPPEVVTPCRADSAAGGGGSCGGGAIVQALTIYPIADNSGDDSMQTPSSLKTDDNKKRVRRRFRKSSSSDDALDSVASSSSAEPETKSGGGGLYSMFRRRRMYSSGDELSCTTSLTAAEEAEDDTTSKETFHTRSLTRYERLVKTHESASEGWRLSRRNSVSKCDCADSALYEFILGACALVALENAELKKQLQDQNQHPSPAQRKAAHPPSKRKFSLLKGRRRSLPSLKDDKVQFNPIAPTVLPEVR